jgi:ABC-type transport system involved in cytochrome bd biosynthesis fused ATPase/permease subunit
MNRFLARLVPFIFLGIMIVLLVVGFVIFSYILMFGALVGVVLFVVAWIRETFFSPKDKNLMKRETDKKPGRVIDHDK